MAIVSSHSVYGIFKAIKDIKYDKEVSLKDGPDYCLCDAMG